MDMTFVVNLNYPSLEKRKCAVTAGRALWCSQCFGQVIYEYILFDNVLDLYIEDCSIVVEFLLSTSTCVCTAWPSLCLIAMVSYSFQRK